MGWRVSTLLGWVASLLMLLRITAVIRILLHGIASLLLLLRVVVLLAALLIPVVELVFSGENAVKGGPAHLVGDETTATTADKYEEEHDSKDSGE